jgi:hypothetical protein
MARDEVEDTSGRPMSESDPLDEALGRKNNGIISPEGRELGQYVRDLYASGAKLWTVEALRHVEEELTKDPRPESVMIRSSA